MAKYLIWCFTQNIRIEHETSSKKVAYIIFEDAVHCGDFSSVVLRKEKKDHGYAIKSWDAGMAVNEPLSIMRMISLSDGTCMGNSVFVFQTNAPVEKLQELERISCDTYNNGGDEEDIPIWATVLKERGYIFDYIDEYQHVTAFGTSDEWLAEKYPHIIEHYQIKNQS